MAPQPIPTEEEEVGSSSILNKSLSKGQQVMKIVLLVLAVIYLIFGCVLCAVGSYAMEGSTAEITGETLPEGIIAVGVFLILTSILGIISIAREFRLGLGVYFVLMALWTIILVSVGIAVVVEKDNATNLVNSGWKSLSSDSRATIQLAMGCCGRNFYNETVMEDSTTISYVSGAGPFFDITLDSCTAGASDACTSANKANGVSCPDYRSFGYDTYSPSTGSTGGCTTSLVSTFEDNYQTAGACGIAFAVIMFVGGIFTCWLMRGIKQRTMNEKIEKNQLKTAKDKERRRQRGKGGLKIPDTVL